MLFIQKTSVFYQKNVRYANYANQRQTVKFYPLTVTAQKPADKNAEVFYTYKTYFQMPDEMKVYKEHSKYLDGRAYYDGRGICDTYGGKIAVEKTNDGKIKVMTYLHKWKDYYRTCFELARGEYGRVICNERHSYFDGNWAYELTTFNLLYAPDENLRVKMFCRKDPDKEFDDRKYLRYCM